MVDVHMYKVAEGHFQPGRNLGPNQRLGVIDPEIEYGDFLTLFSEFFRRNELPSTLMNPYFKQGHITREGVSLLVDVAGGSELEIEDYFRDRGLIGERESLRQYMGEEGKNMPLNLKNLRIGDLENIALAISSLKGQPNSL